MPKVHFILIFLLCFSAFGEKTSEKNEKIVQQKIQSKKGNQNTQVEVQSKKSQVIQVKIQTKENKKGAQTEAQSKAGNQVVQEKIQPKKDNQDIQVKTQPEKESTPGLSEESTGPFTYYEALEKYKKSAHLEWLLGLGYSDSRIMWVPLALEIHFPVEAVGENLTWLFQAGGMFGLTALQGAFGTSVLQTGFKYKFSRGAYGSFKIGPIGVLTESFPPPIWTGGLFFGFGSNMLMMELGVQSFYSVEKNLWDYGIFFNMGSVISKWWSQK